MNEVYIKKDELSSYISKYFRTDFISVDDLICCIEDLDEEVDRLKEIIEDLEKDVEDNYKPIKKEQQYEVHDLDFI